MGKSKDKPVEVRRRTRSKSPARSQTKSKSPSRSRSKSPSRTPVKSSSKVEKLTSKSEAIATSETKARSSRKSETSTVTKNATPKKTIQAYEYVKTSKSSKILESESPSRQSSRIAVKLTQVTPLLTERKRDVKTEMRSEVTTTEKSKLHKGTQIGTLLFLSFFGLIYIALAMAISMLCNLTTCNVNQLPTMPRMLTAFIDVQALLIVVGWIVLQAVLACVPIGFVRRGPLMPDGKRLLFRCNGLFAMVATAIILAAMYYLKWPVFDMVSKHFIQMVVIGIIAGILFGIVSHIASRLLPPKLVSHRANTGSTVGDALIGRYLSPRILNVDLKMFFLFNIGLLGHMFVCAITFVEAYQRDKMNLAMMLAATYTTVLCLHMMLLQTQFVDSMFVMHDGFGILFTMSMMTVPFFDSVVQRYLLHYPQDLCYPLIAASVISFVVGFFIFARSTYVKEKFRRTPHDPCFAAYDVIPTISGKSLIASGLWGWCRHPNYFGWILMVVSLCLLGGYTCPLAYFYAVWVLLAFIMRAHDDGKECRRKHGESAWMRYCQRVRSRLIPYIY